MLYLTYHLTGLWSSFGDCVDYKKNYELQINDTFELKSTRMQIAMKLVIPFSAIFPDEKPLSVKEYLNGVSREMLMNIGSFFLGFDHADSKYSDPYKFLALLLSKNVDLYAVAARNLESYLDATGHTIDEAEIPYVITSLKFFEHAFDHSRDNEETKTEQQMEVDILRAYLLINELSTKERDEASSTIKDCLPPNKRSAGILLMLQLHNFDLTNYDFDKLFSTQFLRALMFFEFLTQRDDCKILLEEFYNYFGVADYKEYLKRILPLTASVVKRTKEAHTDIVLEEATRADDIEFLDKLSVDDEGVLEGFDFKNIRARPIYKISPSAYRIISPLFAMESVYNGLYWKFKEIYDRLPKDKRPKDLYGLKTLQYSEQFVLNELLNSYSKEADFKKTGEQLDGTYDGAPDFYVRKDNNIILFESKDIMLNAEVKQSTRFADIQDALTEKLYKKADGTPKAVMQLINNVRKILRKSSGFDSDYSESDVRIHPVLVLHYRMFNTAGLNGFLNFWFQEELKALEQEGLDISNVRPLVVIDVDTLIFNKDVFTEGKLDLGTCLTEYQNSYLNYSVAGKLFRSQGEMVQAVKNSYLPFANYLDSKVDKMGQRKIPREIMEKGYTLFD